MANEVLATVKPGDKIEHHGKEPYRWSMEQGVIQFPDWKSLTRSRRRIYQPSSLTETEIRKFVASRQRLFQEERLLDDEIYSAYKKLFAPKASSLRVLQLTMEP